MTRIAFAMEQSLGNVTHYLNLRAAQDAAPWLDAAWLPIQYRSGRLPWAVSGSIATARTCRPALEDVSALFVHTTTLALLTPAMRPKRPLVLSTDGPPDKTGMRGWYNLGPEGRFAGPLKRKVYSAIIKRAEGVVAWCEWTKTALVDGYGVDPDRIAVIPPGVDVEQFAPGDRVDELPQILFVGGDFARKGGDLLLDVFRRRLAGRAELVLVTGAKLPEEPGIRVFNGLGANSAVLRQLYAGSDLLALPTRADMLPLVAMEALASGLPIVTTRIGGLPDLVRDGSTGRLIDVDDADRLGDALEELVSDTTLRHRMSRDARQDALERFDARTNALRLFDFVRTFAEDLRGS